MAEDVLAKGTCEVTNIGLPMSSLLGECYTPRAHPTGAGPMAIRVHVSIAPCGAHAVTDQKDFRLCHRNSCLLQPLFHA